MRGKDEQQLDAFSYISPEHTGAHGYVVKTDAGSELLEGVNAVLRGQQFVGRRLSSHDFVGSSHTAAFQDQQSIG